MSDERNIIATLRHNLNQLPSGAFGGGTHRAASQIVDGLSHLSDASILPALEAEAASPAYSGELAEWLGEQVAELSR